jgi:hypothetical protein
MQKIVQETLKLDSAAAIEKIKSEFPEYKPDDSHYSIGFMRAMEEEINSGKTQKDRDEIRKRIQEYDLFELSQKIGTSDVRDIRNIIRENYTHHSLLKEIKSIRDLRSLSKNEINNRSEENISSSSIDKINDTMNLFE